MTTRSAGIRARLDHPIVDADGHLLEFMPLVMEAMQEEGGADILRRFQERAIGIRHWTTMTPSEVRDIGLSARAWWVPPAANLLDRATAHLPRLLAGRMDDLGIDFAVLYPTMAIMTHTMAEDEVRQVACRAMNRYLAEHFLSHPDRMTPVAVIPMHTPQEAIAEIDHAVVELGLKAIMIPGHVMRPLPALVNRDPELGRYGWYLDTYGIDSPYDYDPFWARCVELGVAPAQHAVGQGQGFRRSASNYVYNHIGAFGQAGEAFAKSLFLGGVTHRFPTMNVACLEGGVDWACGLYAGLIGHWTKRNGEAVKALDPRALDMERFGEMVTRHGDPAMVAALDRIKAFLRLGEPHPKELDDFHRVPIRGPEDIRDLFVPRFYFGCEADDPLASVAFNRKLHPFGVRLNAMLSSDMGHWDVPDMSTVVAEAYELVEDGLLSPEDFKEFAFGNVARLYGGMNPGFFKGTRVESQAAKVLGAAEA